VKRSSISAAFENMIFSASGYSGIRIEGDNTLLIFDYAGSFNYKLATTQVFRDSSAWYHLVFALDTTQATASNRLKLYVNGIEVTQFSATTYPSLNYDGFVNAATAHNIGRNPDAPTQKFDGYLADIHFIDGQALDPTSFGEFDTNGVWQPIDASGLTFGTNGFHLPFSDNSTAAALGTDTSSNGNTWTVNNIAVGGTNYTATGTLSGATTSSLNGLFDGDLSGTYWTIQPSGTSNATVTFSPKLPAGTTIEIYGWKNGSISSGAVEVNGTDVSSIVADNFPGVWADVSSAASGGIETIKIYRQDGTVNMTLSGIRVDGTVLINATPAANDSLVDSPVNGSQVDTGVWWRGGGELLQR
jgi:hypothetical protein